MPAAAAAAASAQTLFIARSGDDVILFYAPPFSSWHPRWPNARVAGLVDSARRLRLSFAGAEACAADPGYDVGRAR